MHGSGAVSCACSLLIRGPILPAVRQKLHLSPCADYRSPLYAKDSDKQEVALHRRQTTTKRSQRGEHGQLPHAWVHLPDTFHFALILEAPRPAGLLNDGPGLATTHCRGASWPSHQRRT